ncbi:MAG: hypothetical protein P9L99_19555 [Candidatus Lernaella stagnicola]|nr:hypothetical protein [Candidatus Lernaella stagnicola]
MTRISKLPYVISISLTLFLSLVARMAFMNNSMGRLAFARFMYLIAAVLVILMYYKAWKALQDEEARTTPGKALGYSFIPVFNVYWIFVVMAGFAADYNSYVERHELPIEKRMGTGLYWVTAFCWIFAFLVMKNRPLGGVLLFVLLAAQTIGAIKVINAVNLLADAQEGKIDESPDESAAELTEESTDEGVEQAAQPATEAGEVQVEEEIESDTESEEDAKSDGDS